MRKGLGRFILGSIESDEIDEIKMAEQVKPQGRPALKPAAAPVRDPNLKYIVRIIETELDGNKPILDALRKIKGVSFSLANAVCSVTGIDKHKKVGYLNEAELKTISDAIKNPLDYKMPLWMLNRRKDPIEGTDRHLTAINLSLANEDDVKRLKSIKCWRGIRHMYGQPTRGQRTRSNFRKNKGKVVGVAKKRIAPAKAEGGKKEEKGKK